MTETPVVIHRGRTSAAAKSTEFSFSENDLSLGTEPKELASLKKHAWDVYKTKKIPSLQKKPGEEQTCQNLDPAQFALPKADHHKDLSPAPEDILRPLAGKEHAGQIVLYGAGETIQVSPDLAKKGVVFSTFSMLKKTNPDLLVRLIGKIVKPEEGIFPSMVQSLGQDGILLYVPKGVKVDLPLHSLVWGSAEKTAYLSHVIVFLEEELRSHLYSRNWFP